MTPDDLLTWATAIVAALAVLGPAVALFLRTVRAAWADADRDALTKVVQQRDAQIEGYAAALADLPPEAAEVVKDRLRAAQQDAGVRSDIAPLAERANRSAVERKNTPPPLSRQRTEPPA